MPNASIVVTLQDRYSDTAKKMAAVTKAFTKDTEGLEQRLYALNKNKYTLKLDARKAQRELKDAEKQFSLTQSAADGLKVELAQANYDNIVRNLRAVTKAAGETEKAISKTVNKAESTGSGGGGTAGIVSAIAQTGLANLAGNVVLDASKTIVSSLFGTAGGTVVSSGLSMAITGAAMGSIIPGIGTAVGAGIGAAAGAVSGLIQNFQNQDDAFKDYVQEAYEGQATAQETSLTTGSALAAQREKDRISFATLFGDAGIADTYLSNLVEMSNNTPFLYGDLTAMSKTLATYGYKEDGILPVLQTVGDAGAALGQSVSDMEAVATAIGRMKSSDKATLEYLNILNDRGIGAVGMLAEAKGVSQGTMYDMISKGQIAGGEAAEIILQAMADSFSGSMLEQAKTFSGLTSTVEGLSQELDNAMGEGYNQGRMAGLQAQRDWLSGESGQAVMEANKAIGAWKAELENSKERYIRDAVDAMMESSEYQTAKTSGDAAEMGRLIMEAKVQGMNEYNASEGAQLALEAEKSLVQSIREDTSLNSDYWDAGYEKGQWFTKGLADAMSSRLDLSAVDPMLVDVGGASGWGKTTRGKKRNVKGFAVGLDYVPYDNFPALLHQGERVLTAAEARSERSAPSITITGNTFTIREEADVSRVASELLEQMGLAGMRG